MTTLRQPKPTAGAETEHVLETLAARVHSANAGSYREITNAMTGEPLGRVPHCTRDDVVAAARRARELQPEWAARPIRERAEVMLRFHDLVLSHQDEVLDVIQLENGKARRHTRTPPGTTCPRSAGKASS